MNSALGEIFGSFETLTIQALCVGERLDLRGLAITDPFATAPLLVKAGQMGCAVLFRYGAVVLINLEPIEVATFLENLAPFILGSFSQTQTEQCQILFDSAKPERISEEGIWLQEGSVEHLQVIAEILAQSTILDHYEQQITQVFERIQVLAEAIQDQGRKRPKDQDLLRHIGGTLLIQQRMVGLVEIGEKPETLWERPDLEKVYGHLEEEYELRDRLCILERKLDLISRTAETALELMQHDSSQRVEWYIVCLIVLEILLTLYQLFLK
jgi:uncharacterized Rmd1/YagE family protein